MDSSSDPSKSNQKQFVYIIQHPTSVLVYGAIMVVLTYYKAGIMVALFALGSVWLVAVFSIYHSNWLLQYSVYYRLFLAVSSAIILGLILLAFGLWAVKQEGIRHPNLKAHITSAYIDAGNHFKYWYCSNRELKISDVNIMIHIRATNNIPTPIQISGYKLEARSVVGFGQRWNQLQRINILNPKREGIMISPKNVYIDVSQSNFDYKTRKQVIEPGHSIKGFAFFLWIASPPRWTIDELRLTIIDMNGGKSQISQIVKAESKLDITKSSLEYGALATMPKEWKPSCL